MSTPPCRWPNPASCCRHLGCTPPPPQALHTELVEVDNGGPAELNFILGQAHFIKTAEDLAEALFMSGTAIKWAD